MTWEYKTIESTDFGHPGGVPRYQELSEELGKLSAEGWEVVQIVPTMQRGRADASAGGGKESSTVTVVAMLVMLRRAVTS
jgi:hypothetical protein